MNPVKSVYRVSSVLLVETASGLGAGGIVVAGYASSEACGVRWQAGHCAPLVSAWHMHFVKNTL